MNCYHTRVIVLHYSDEDLKHVDGPMQNAIGRAVLYGLDREALSDTEQLVSVALNKGDFTSAYYKPLRQYQNLDTTALQTPNPFIVGAVPYNGAYSFNS